MEEQIDKMRQCAKELDVIYRALKQNNRDYMQYYRLAQIKEQCGAYKQAQLSYENAAYFSTDEKYDSIAGEWQKFCQRHPETVCPVSIILVTYNQLEMTKLCIESIRYNNPYTAYEIIIVDNMSVDGTREWLQKQEDIRYILNDENKGFPAACNQGAALASEGNDIFFLNNDTIIMINSIYNLRMALYESDEIGITGACSNSVGSNQVIDEVYSSIEEYGKYADRKNCYFPKEHKQNFRLVGFAMMLRYSVWQKTGGFDEIFGIGNFEDDDLCMKALDCGLQLLYCPDSFIYHFGRASFRQEREDADAKYAALMDKNKKIFRQKWKFPWEYLIHVKTEVIALIQEKKNHHFSVLDVGCGTGATLLEIRHQYPEADLYGMEEKEILAKVASCYFPVSQQEYVPQGNPFNLQYDYILLGDEIEYIHDPKSLLQVLKSWLKPGGHLLLSVPNLLHISVLMSLLHGKLVYKEAEMLEKQCVKLYTKQEIADLLADCGLAVDHAAAVSVGFMPEEKMYQEKLCQMDTQIDAKVLEYFQYVFRCH